MKEAYCARFFSLVSTFPNFVMHCSRYKDIKFSSFFSQHIKSTYFLGYSALFLPLSGLSDYHNGFNSYSLFKQITSYSYTFELSIIANILFPELSVIGEVIEQISGIFISNSNIILTFSRV